eukprot:TRINITY_DN47_c0_g1_i1.p1 TRINITY_DN47_c0_g1~~TRINITY_DN47_c0_g1_i1.p1  ORF type:complete len:314 (+),score=68.10 TRINITY_DN47_c0_g1_i1:178-1119(+)
MGFSDTVNSIFDVVVFVLLIISIVGAGLTLITFLIFKEIRTYPIKLICYLCVCIDIGFFAFIMAGRSYVAANTGACIFIAIVLHFMFIANFCWTFCIAFNFYQMIVRRNRESQLLEKWYHLGCWGIPTALCVAVGASDSYGNLNPDNKQSSVCYIDSDLLRFLTFFIPGLVIISSNGILFFFIGREIHETLSGAPKSDQRDRKKEFRVYISIYVSIGLSWIFGYLMFLIPQEVVVSIFFIIFSIMTPAQGALVFLFYCVNKKVASKWAGLFGKCIPFCKDLEATFTNSTMSGSSKGSGSSSRGVDSGSSASSI